MILIPAGEFLMGSDPAKVPFPDDPVTYGVYAGGWETHQHTLSLPDYHLARTPVTNAQYAAFLHETNHPLPKRWRSRRSPRGKEDFPIVYVSWHDAMAYCHWLVETTAKPYRLPSEAEWEKAARGITGRLYPWGDQWDPSRCNTLEGEAAKITPVDAYPQGASPYGLLDMAGNVWEWTSSVWGRDWYKPEFVYPYDPADGREELKADDRVCRVLRGGSYAYSKAFARCAYRYKNFPRTHSDGIGFRVAVSSM
jgi:formylglycine-generating enzyme required for sulfatase activity